MKNTTIAISKDIKEKIKELGNKGETYSEIIEKLYNNTKKKEIQDILMDSSDSIPVKKALEKAKKKWQK